MSATIAAEWLKLRSMRGTALSLAMVAIGVGLTALLAWYVGQQWDAATPPQRAQASIVPLEHLTTEIVQMAMGVLGVLAATAEYADGTLRLTLLASPRRGRLVAAKALVVGVVAALAGGTAVLTTYRVTPLIMEGRGIAGLTDPADPRTRWMLLAWALVVPMVALSGLGLGLCLRSGAGAITVLALVLYVVPILAQVIPGPAGLWIRSVLPGALPLQLSGKGTANSVYRDLLGPGGAAVAMLAYPGVLLGAGL
ncbi:MAG: type transport system permease protein, partial [Actinomycetota bacterium]|nr:type transport system permease protein [Actinomycetota bacterium]